MTWPPSTAPGQPAPGVVFTPAELALRLARGLELAAGDRLLDPACGDGALLAAALAARAERHGHDPSWARSSLFGIEIDPELAERARERLAREAGLPRGTELDGHILTGDALAAEPAWPAGAHVLANPPWVSFSGRQARPGLRGSAAAGAGWPALQSRFLERIARHIGPSRSRARLLVPAALTELAGYGPARRLATAWARLTGPPEDLGERAFPGVVEPTAIVALEGLGAAGQGSSARWSEPAALDRGWLARLAERPRLPARTFADPGVHTGNCARELVHRPWREPWANLREGRCLSAFALAPASAALRLDLAPGAGRSFRRRALEHYAAFPVLVRQTADRPIAALHREPGFFRNSLLAARAVPGLDPAFVVAVLNGPVAAAWHRANFADARQRAFPQVKVGHLATQPFPFVQRAAAPRAHDAVAARARALHELAPAHPARAGAEAELAAHTLALFELDPADAARVAHWAARGA